MAGNETFDLGLRTGKTTDVRSRLSDIADGAPLAGEPPKPRTVEDVARDTGVPWNVIEIVATDAGITEEQKIAFADDFAGRMKEEMAKGQDVPGAMKSIFGNDAPVEDALDRAIGLAGGAVEGRAAAGQSNDNSALEDAGRSFAGGALTGVGAIADGVGVLLDVDDAFGDPGYTDFFETAGVAVGGWLQERGIDVQEGMSDDAKKAIRNSTPEGKLFEPSTWTFQGDVSVEGITMLTANVLGSLAPVVIAGVTTGPVGAAAVGGLQSTGAGAQTAREIIDKASPEALKANSGLYNEMIAAGKSHEEAKEKVKDASAALAGVYSGIVGAGGGAATGALVSKGVAPLASRGIATRVAGTAAVGAAEEGTQEVLEGVVARAGTEQGSGLPVDKMEGTFGEAVLGALGGGVVGGVRGAVPAAEAEAEGGDDDEITGEQPAAEGEAPPEQPGDQLPPEAGPVARAAQAAPAPVAPAVMPDPTAQPGQMVRVTPGDGRAVDAEYVGEDEAGIDVTVDGRPVRIARDEIEAGRTQVEPVDALSEAAWGDAEAKPNTSFSPIEDTSEPPAQRAERMSTALDAYLTEQKIEADDALRAEVVNDIDRYGGSVQQAVDDLIEFMRAQDIPENTPAPKIDPAGEMAAADEAMRPGAPAATVPGAGALRGPETNPRVPDAPAAEPTAPEQPTPELGALPAPAAGDTPDARWDGMSPDKREALLSQIGFRNKDGSLTAPGRRATTRPWADLSERVREKLGERMTQAGDAAPVAPGADPNLGLPQQGRADFVGERPDPQVPEAGRTPRQQPGVNELPEGAEPIAPPAQDGQAVVGGAQSTAERGKPSGNGIFTDAQLFGDALITSTVRAKGFQSLDRDRQGVVLAQMISALDDPQVLQAVIETVPVDVMDVLVGRKRSAKSLLNQPAMLTRRLTIASDVPVPEPVVRFIDALAASVEIGSAGGVTEEADLPGVGSLPQEGVPAGGALPAAGLDASTGAENSLTTPGLAGSGETDPAGFTDENGHYHTSVAGQDVVIDGNPSDAQKEAGNYRKGAVRWQGLDVTIENAKGQERKGTGPDGTEWSVTMPADYGYIRGTEGADSDPIDIYMGPDAESDSVFVVDQQDERTGKWDEHKVILGTRSRDEALDIYRAGFSDGKAEARIRAVSETTVDGFKAWLEEGDLTEPAVAYFSPVDGDPLYADQEAINSPETGEPEAEPTGTAKGAREGSGYGRTGSDSLNASLSDTGQRLRADTDIAALREGGQTRQSRAKPVARLNGDEITTNPNMREMRGAVVRWYRENLVGDSVTNAETGMEIRFSKRGANKTVNAKGEDILRAVAGLREILRDGKYLGAEPDRKGRHTVKAVHKFSALVSVGDRMFSVVATVREAPNGSFHYDLSKEQDRDGARARRPSVNRLEANRSGLDGDPAATLNLVEEATNFNEALPEKRADGQPNREAMRAIKTELDAEIARLGLTGKVSASAWRSLSDGPMALEGFYRAGEIGVSASDGDPIATMHHEIIHALRDPALWGGEKGIFTAAEWRTVVRAARADKAIMRKVQAEYRDQPQSVQTEEAVAELYRQWRQGTDAGPVSRLMQRIADVLEALAGVLRGNGFEAAGDVFAKIASGEIGGRGPDGPGGQPRDGDGRFMAKRAALPTPQDAGRVTVQARNMATGLDRIVSDTVTNAMKDRGGYNLLALVPGRALFKELGRKIGAAQTYLSLKEKMDTKRNDKHAETDLTAQKWRRAMNRDKAANVEMMKLMHDSTIAQVDPAERFEQPDERWNRVIQEGRKRNAIAFDKAIEEQARYEERKASHEDLAPRFKALPKEFQALYREVRDSYRKLDQEQTNAIIGQVERAMAIAEAQARRKHEKTVEQAEKRYQGALRRINADKSLTGTERTTAKAKAKMERDEAIAESKASVDRAAAARARTSGEQVKSLRAQFETNRLQGPYFPLSRFGEYFVLARDDEGNVVSFSRHQTVQEQRAEQKDREADGHEVQVGVMSETDARDMVDPSFVADIQGMLSDVNADEKLLDDIWQRWLATLPDMSVRKHRIHRKNREGYDADALKAFGNHMFHGSHQLARLIYSLDMQEQLDLAQEQAAESADPVRNGFIVNEMSRRHAFTMSPTGAWWASKATSAAFIYYLSVSPAAAIVNLSQTSIVGTAVLGRHGGTKKAAGALSKALADFTRSKDLHAEKNTKHLTSAEREAMHEAYKRGVIDRTQAHDLAQVAESGVAYDAKHVAVMNKISWLFHHSERMNREVTFLAGYRMLREKGVPHDEAITQAGDMTWEVHFDYQQSSKSRFMQTPHMQVLMTFRNFSVNFLWRIFRDLHQSVKGEDAETRKEARRQAASMATMMLFHAGIKGMYGYGIVMALMGMFFGDDEDDPEERLEKFLFDYLPRPVVKAMLDGVPGTAAGINLTSRIGMPNLWFRPPLRPLEGADLYQHYVNEVLGPIPGIGMNLATGTSRLFEGADLQDPSLMWRGVETAMPKAIRDLMKSGRYAYEGALTYNGDPIMDDFSAWDIIAQASGFTPKELSDRYDQNGRIKKKEGAIRDRRSNVIKQVAETMKDGGKVTDRHVKLMQEFNAEYPEWPITWSTIRGSVRGRMQRSQRNEGGVQVNPRLDPRLRGSLSPLVAPE